MSPRTPHLLDTLAGLIPGFTGYAEREGRRAQDRRLRDHVAQELDRASRQLDGLIEILLTRGMLDGLDAIDALKRQVGTCADSLRHVQEGASGLMDQVAVKTADLDRVLEHDRALHDQAEGLTRSIAALTSSTLEGLAGVRDQARALKSAIQKRDDLLREVFH